eukprot:3030293-Rhodomonas_salina.1
MAAYAMHLRYLPALSYAACLCCAVCVCVCSCVRAFVCVFLALLSAFVTGAVWLRARWHAWAVLGAGCWVLGAGC